MTRKTVWGIALALAFGAGLIAAGFSSPVAQGAEADFPPMTAGDSYAFIGISGSALSGVLMTVGPYPWVEVKLDNNDANIYQINLKQVTRFKHLSK